MGRRPLEFHRKLPGYRPTPLLSAPSLAERFGIGEVLLKCESRRLGLPAFKILGASWATWKALCEHLGEEPGPWNDVEALAELLAPLRPFTLAAATDGNHGRAVARMARLLGFSAHIFVPEGTSRGRIEGIAGEGASVEVVDGDYDAAVARSAQEAGPRCLVISDTSWPGYDGPPRWVIEGYSTMFWEIEDALCAGKRPAPDLVVIPIGVGALAAAAVGHFWSPGLGPVMVGVEPTTAACVTTSALAGRPVTVPGPHHSIMAGLNCGTPSPVAWPAVSAGLDGFVDIDDGWACDAVRDLAALGVEAGETGAAALGGLAALASASGEVAGEAAAPPTPASRLSLRAGATALVIVTEGASDPAGWRRILGVELVGTDPPRSSTAAKL